MSFTRRMQMWTNPIARFISVSILLVACSQSSAAQESAETLSDAERDAMLGQMAGIIVPSILRSDTNHAVFHGCFDWHSAVHGHWALLRIARVTSAHEKQALLVERSLSASGIAQERKYLKEHPTFEMPYGRAWFLRLAVEFELGAVDSKWKDPQRLRPMADEIANSVLTHYEKTPPSPSSAEYANASWALYQLHSYARQNGSDEFLRRVAVLVQGYMLKPKQAPTFLDDRTQGEFFSRFGNWAYLIAGTQDEKGVREFLSQHPLSDEAIRPVRLLPTAHHLGMNWSRAWALKALSRGAAEQAERDRFYQAYLAHVRSGMASHATHAGNYATYDHWVPQFAVYALTE